MMTITITIIILEDIMVRYFISDSVPHLIDPHTHPITLLLFLLMVQALVDIQVLSLEDSEEEAAEVLQEDGKLLLLNNYYLF